MSQEDLKVRASAFRSWVGDFRRDVFVHGKFVDDEMDDARLTHVLDGVVEAQAELYGGEHSEELFFADFHRAPYRVGMGRVVESCGFDEVFAAEEHPGAVGSA